MQTARQNILYEDLSRWWSNIVNLSHASMIFVKFIWCECNENCGLFSMFVDFFKELNRLGNMLKFRLANLPINYIRHLEKVIFVSLYAALKKCIFFSGSNENNNERYKKWKAKKTFHFRCSAIQEMPFFFIFVNDVFVGISASLSLPLRLYEQNIMAGNKHFLHAKKWFRSEMNPSETS